MIAEDSAVMLKVRELCTAITEDSHFKGLQKKVEEFFDDEKAPLMYRSVQERGSELEQKQRAGVALGAAEIQEFESARDELLDNKIAHGFLDAQGELEGLQRAISKFIGLTLELGHVPTAEEVAEANSGGCCGGGGCGC